MTTHQSSAKTPLLIYIPTYKRFHSLKCQLAALIEEIIRLSGTSNHVEVYVSINGRRENQDSLQLLKSLAAKYQFIKYHIHSGNIGGNANIAQGFSLAPLDYYLWLLSDNDIIQPGLLERILRNIQELSPDVTILAALDHPRTETLNYNRLTLDDFEGVFGLGLISRGIYKIEYLQDSMHIAYIYHNTSFPHLAVFFRSFMQRKYCKFLFLDGEAFIQQEGHPNDYVANYNLSYAGRAQLIGLLPSHLREKYARDITKELDGNILRASKQYPFVLLGSLASIVWYTPRALLIPVRTATNMLISKVVGKSR